MKKKLFLVFVLCYFFNVCSNAKETPSENCLAIVGTFSNLVHIKDVFVYLYNDSVIIDSAKVNSTKDFGFMLECNKQYSLHILAGGYYSRLIKINTIVPANVNTSPVFIFEFEVELLKVTKGVDDFFMDFPIALISYEAKIEKFTFSKKYTDFIQKELKKIESQFKVRKSR